MNNSPLSSRYFYAILFLSNISRYAFAREHWKNVPRITINGKYRVSVKDSFTVFPFGSTRLPILHFFLQCDSLLLSLPLILHFSVHNVYVYVYTCRSTYALNHNHIRSVHTSSNIYFLANPFFNQDLSYRVVASRAQQNRSTRHFSFLRVISFVNIPLARVKKKRTD